MTDDFQRIADRVRAAALLYPESFEELPWGDRVTKVRDKIFVFCGVHKGRLGVTCKLPVTGQLMLAAHSWAKPTGYGLGKAGWVSAGFGPGDPVQVELLTDWIDESYRVAAPKALLKLLPDQGTPSERAPQDLSAIEALDLPGAILFIGADELRTARAAQTLEDTGHAAAAAGFDPGAFVTAEELGGAAAVVVDLVRDGAEGLAVGVDVAASFGAALVLTGIKDKKHETLIRETVPDAKLYGRKAPGDVGFLEQLGAALE